MFFAVLMLAAHLIAINEGHPINCVKNPSEAVCEYNLNK